MNGINFKKGIYQLNSEPNFNFQLNRIIMWDGGRLDDIEPIASKITDSNSWKKELIFLGDKALDENRIENAIAYYRMSEFFMYDGDKDKLKYYRKANVLFYDFYAEFFDKKIVEKIEVPYEDIFLPVLHVKPDATPKDTIILHGGNDSYFEELFLPMLYFLQNGFEVYLMEGPGQGGVLREQHKHFTHQWEKPISAILDSLGLDNITIIGASLGGMLAPRAAAFDKRIQRVIGWSIFPNFLDVALHFLPKLKRNAAHWCIKNNIKLPINMLVNKMMKSSQTIDWAFKHGMYAYQAKTPFEYLKILNNFQILDVADKITQDVLILGASNDHFIAKELYKKELDSLINVRSLTYRLFTDKESASNHCNVGNSKLCFDTMMSWIASVKNC